MMEEANELDLLSSSSESSDDSAPDKTASKAIIVDDGVEKEKKRIALTHWLIRNGRVANVSSSTLTSNMVAIIVGFYSYQLLFMTPSHAKKLESSTNMSSPRTEQFGPTARQRCMKFMLLTIASNLPMGL